jgi:putative hydrolase of the HAD superfamily
VLSNTLWPRWHHEAVFSRDGLAPFIDAAVYSSEIPVAKPHAEAFLAAVQAVGSVVSRTVFVGDRPWDDVHGAQEVGMRAILIPHSRLGDQAVEVDVTPDAVVARLGDVLDIVLAWRASR